MCIPGTCECSLFWWLNPTKQGLFILYLTVLVFLIFSATCGYLWVSLYLSFDRHNTDMMHIIYVYIYIYKHTTPLEMAQADPQTK